MTKTPREDWAEGSPSPLELFITGKHSCPHPLIPSNHDNCRGAVILSPGQPPQGSSHRGAEGSGGRSFPSIAATCRVARRLGTAPLPRPGAVWRGYSTAPPRVPGHPQTGPGLLLLGMGQDAGATLAVGRA